MRKARVANLSPLHHQPRNSSVHLNLLERNSMTPPPVSRRSFIGQMAVAGAAAATAPLFNVHAQGAARKFRVGVIGCGGRGNGAIENILEAAKIVGADVEVHSLVDFFPERAATTAKKFGVPAERAFSGATGYHKLLEQPVDIVILATPPNFRPLHLE